MAIAAVVLTAPAAYAGVRDSRGIWVFDPETYRKKERAKSEISDPVTLVFKGGGGDVTYNRVARHLQDDFELDSKIPFAKIHWGTRRKNPFCQGRQYMYFLRPDYVNDPDGLRHWAFTGSSNSQCTTQYHGRFWTDERHAMTTFDHPYNQWVVGTIHHERARPKHKIDMDWSLARGRMVTAMRLHCSRRRFGMHPGAKTMYQGWHHDRILARISMRHRVDGCSGA